jgi:hypothetical protein
VRPTAFTNVGGYLHQGPLRDQKTRRQNPMRWQTPLTLRFLRVTHHRVDPSHGQNHSLIAVLPNPLRLQIQHLRISDRPQQLRSARPQQQHLHQGHRKRLQVDRAPGLRLRHRECQYGTVGCGDWRGLWWGEGDRRGKGEWLGFMEAVYEEEYMCH